MKETRVPVCNTIILKSIKDDEDRNDGLIMVAKLVQRVFDIPHEIETEDAHFPYRFNDKSAGEYVEKRRTKPIVSQGVGVVGATTTFEALIPLEVDTLFSFFPFQICVARVNIGLSSLISSVGETFRPDLILHTEDPRNNFNIQNLDTSAPNQMLLEGITTKEMSTRKHFVSKILDKIDRSQVYDFISPHPKIYYQYDSIKGYCPGVVVSFIVNRFSFISFVKLILPMILVTCISAMNAIHDLKAGEGMDVASHLQVTSALTLTIVFILPDIVETTNRGKVLTRGNMIVIVFFFGMLLSSIPRSLFSGGQTSDALSKLYATPEVVGVVLMGCSLIFPLIHSYEYISIRRRIKDMAELEAQTGFFVMEQDTPKWKPQSVSDNILSVGEILKQGNQHYMESESGNNDLGYRNGGKKSKERYRRLHLKPTHEEPISGKPTHEEPISGKPTHEEPISEEPKKTESVYGGEDSTLALSDLV